MKYILAVLQAPSSPTKLPYDGLSASDMYTTKLEAGAEPVAAGEELSAGRQVVGAHCSTGSHLLTSGHSVGQLPNRNGAGRGDGRRHHGRAAGLLHLLTSRRAVDYRTASAQDTQTQAAIAGALLAYRTGDVFTTNQITSALVAHRSAADQDTATALSIAAALLSCYTIAQVDGLLAGKLGVTEAASALQIAQPCAFRTTEGPTQQRLQRRPGHAHRGVSVDGYTLTLV